MPDPLHRWVPDYSETYGDLAAEQALDVGMTMDDDQVDILNAIFAEDEPGIPNSFEVGVVAPRQNIKTSTLEIAALADVFTFGVRSHVWTAHLYSTTQKSFEHMVELVGSCEDLRTRCVWPPREAHGEQAIELLTGEKIEFRARSRGGGRGFTGVERITFDEALFLKGTTMGALLPTLATVRGAQVRYGSSAGFPDSDSLRSIRDRGRRGGEPRLAYFEWGAPRVECADKDCEHPKDGSAKGCAVDRVDLWHRANPALGRRIELQTMQDFRRSMPPAEFMREFLSWWEDPPTDTNIERAITADVYTKTSAPRSDVLDPVVLGIDVSPVRRTTLSAVGWTEDGRKHGEVIYSRPGTDWLVDVLTAVVAQVDPVAVVLDPGGPAGSLIPDIEAAQLEVTTMTLRQRTAADRGMVDDLEQGHMVLVPGGGLDDAVAATTWRELRSGAQAFARGGPGDISPVVSISNARHGLLLAAATPPKKPPPAPRAIPADTVDDLRETNLDTVGF